MKLWLSMAKSGDGNEILFFTKEPTERTRQVTAYPSCECCDQPDPSKKKTRRSVFSYWKSDRGYMTDMYICPEGIEGIDFFLKSLGIKKEDFKDHDLLEVEITLKNHWAPESKVEPEIW